MIYLPEYIGHPQSQSNNGSDKTQLFSDHMKEKFIYATIRPKIPQIKMDANIYEGKTAWASYKNDLNECGIQPASDSGYIKVVISKLLPITETYSNDYGSSEILPSGGMVSPKLQELMYLTGANDVSDLKSLVQSSDTGILGSGLGKLIGTYESGLDHMKKLSLKLGENKGGLSQLGSKALNAAQQIGRSPWSKINWPQMWRNCNYTSQYSLQTRLYCYHTQTNTDYDQNIRACLAALKLFTTPKSKDGILYTAPYIMDFEITGVLHMPLAYCSNLTVVKGGDNADFSATGKPNIIEVEMTIQNCYGVSVNTPKSSAEANKDRPSVYSEHQILGKGKNIKNPTFETFNFPSPSTSQSTTSSRTPTNSMQDEAARMLG
jgi:hypothetical protein